MSNTFKIFAVINPVTEDQRALYTALGIAQTRKENNTGDTEIIAFCCTHSSKQARNPKELKQVVMKRYQLWLDDLVSPWQEKGFNISTQVEWDPDWREVIGVAANAANPDLVIKGSLGPSEAFRAQKRADWRLLRTSNAPVLLAKKDTHDVDYTGKVLAAVKLSTPDSAYNKLNTEIMDYARTISAALGNSEIHAVSAYKDWDDFVNPMDVAEKLGIERTCGHAVDASPEKAITQIADKIDAEFVIIGTVARKGLAGSLLGNTAERVIDELDCNVLTIVHRD